MELFHLCSILETKVKFSILASYQEPKMNKEMRAQSHRSRGIELPPRVSTRKPNNLNDKTDDLRWGNQSHGYYNRTAYAPNYTEIEMEHMSHVTSNEIPNEETYEVVPDDIISQLPDVQPSLPSYINPGYTGFVPTQPEKQIRCHEKRRCMWVLSFLLLSVTAVLLLVLFGGK